MSTTAERKLNVLVTSAGAASAVTVINALVEQAELPVNVIAADMDPDAAGLFLSHARTVLPHSESAGFGDALIEVCRRLKVDVLLPTHSSEIKLIAALSGRLKSNGVSTLLAPPEVIDLCDDKVEMNRFVASLGIRTPSPVSGPPEENGPFFARPRAGSGADGAQVVSTTEELNSLLRADTEFQVLEMIRGSEYTVDILADRRSSLVVCSARNRAEVRSGQTVRGQIVDRPDLAAAAQRICASLGYVGPANVQFMDGKDGPVFIEFNPRFAAGGLGLTIGAGGNIPLLAVRLAIGEEAPLVKTMTGTRLVRYYRDIVIAPE